MESNYTSTYQSPCPFQVMEVNYTTIYQSPRAGLLYGAPLTEVNSTLPETHNANLSANVVLITVKTLS